ncbi:TSUP family transporter [Planctomycetota bacterium]
MTEAVVLVLVGLGAGGLGGLLGIGGGIVLMPVLRFGVGLPPAIAAGTCVFAVFFTTLGGSFRHHRLGHLNVRSVVPVSLKFFLSFSVVTPRAPCW